MRYAEARVVRDEDTIDHLIDVAVDQIGKRLMYWELIA